MLLTENMVVADRYRLSRMIGRGGMGSVWQAQHLGLDVPCAIKFIEGELANVAEAHQRFEREARAAAQLRSPNVVQIMDHGVWQGIPYIAMELLDGEDLGKYIAKKDDGRIPVSELGPIIQQVCKALSKAHAAGVVHRDLKPDNIFLVNDDEGRPITKILDFGVAKSTSQAIDGSNTKTGAMLGTPYYMSPEQAQGIKSVDSRSDLWSLAVIVFQCVTGRLPFESEALGDLLVKIIVSPIPVPSEIYRGVPPGFDTWWRKAADRNPEGRYQTAKEFSTSLMMALGQSAITDVTDRAKLQRLGGGTAMMPSGRAGSNPPPQQTVQNAPPPHMSTPNPAMQSGGHMPMMQTPPGAIGPHAGGPITNPNMGTANPVVAEAPFDLPKKGPPVGVIVGGLAAFAVVGAILIGVVMTGNNKKTAGSTDPSPSASVATTTTTATSEAKNAQPSATVAASAAPTADPEPVASASASASPTAATAPATKPAAPTGAIAGNTKPAQPTQPATKPGQPAQPAKPAGGTPQKPPSGGLGLGF